LAADDAVYGLGTKEDASPREIGRRAAQVPRAGL